MLCFNLIVEFNSSLLFLQFLFKTLLSLYRSFTVKKVLKKQISRVSVFGYGFFGTVPKTMMNALTKPPDSNSDSDDSDTLSLQAKKLKMKLRNLLNTYPTPNQKFYILKIYISCKDHRFRNQSLRHPLHLNFLHHILLSQLPS